MVKMQSTGTPMLVNERGSGCCTASSLRVIAIRVFVAVSAVAIALDTLPRAWQPVQPIKNWVNTQLDYLGVSQGDWPLFAPNPILNNGMIVAEVVDSKQQAATWNTPDWATATIWQKFYRFRYLNYCQRVGNNRYACEDLADYLQHAIPNQEQITPAIRWSETNDILPPAELVPPIVDIKLYEYRNRMILSPENPQPMQSDTVWSYSGEFLLRREYAP